LEQDLLQRARAGDCEAFGELYAANRAQALRIARRYVRRDLAEDLAEEAFVATFHALVGGAGPDDGFIRYLAVAIRTRAQVFWRVELHESAAAQLKEDCGIAAPDDPRLELAMKAISDRHRRVLWLTLVERCSVEELGAEMGVNANAASALSFRAKRALRTAYAALDMSDQTTRNSAGPLRE